MIIDAHCHLEMNEYLPEIVNHATQAGVNLMVNVGTGMDELPSLIGTMEAYQGIYGIFAVHPHSVEEDDSWKTKDFEGIYSHVKMIGVGETGLDYHYDFSKKDVQKEAFCRHIEVAQKRNLPVIVHTREAQEDTVALLKEGILHQSFDCVIHSFNGTKAFAEQMLDLGCYLSVSGMITFSKAQDLRDTLKYVPLDRLLTETDSPYLAPVPYRGKTNEPAYVVEVIKKLAEIKEVSVDEVQEKVSKNFLKLFGKKVSCYEN
jgi:TatD DNase family protein